MDSERSLGGENIFPESRDMKSEGGAPEVNLGHNPAKAPVVELGGKNPRDYEK